MGVEAESAIRVKVKEEIEEPKEAAVNKREGRADLKGTMYYSYSDEGTNMSDESHEKGRKKMSMGGSSCWKGPAQKP